MSKQQDIILLQVKAERIRQDDKWGGPKHDDGVSIEDWEKVISSYVSWAFQMMRMNSGEKFRRRMIQVAALAVATVEAYDRSLEDTHGLQNIS